ncbi:hypothetical protein LSTR_LSTR001805 [Laodelphax striatellus]|uniref:Uncharacterized protein n=1 Tax=Laodelphax striatellus TaxID=195883 RepID=A0A482WGN8_LAOST|nr:hypothetical protein LSTR_LSTR001805 [Laodelphax striatellus]
MRNSIKQGLIWHVPGDNFTAIESGKQSITGQLRRETVAWCFTGLRLSGSGNTFQGAFSRSTAWTGHASSISGPVYSINVPACSTPTQVTGQLISGNSLHYKLHRRIVSVDIIYSEGDEGGEEWRVEIERGRKCVCERERDLVIETE